MKTDSELINKFYAEHGGKPVPAADIVFYESSWDLLMPVVEKIEELSGYVVSFEIATVHVTIQWDGDFGFYEETTTIEEHESKIQLVYRCVVRFIKWYNTQKSDLTNDKQ